MSFHHVPKQLLNVSETDVDEIFMERSFAGLLSMSKGLNCSFFGNKGPKVG